MGKGQTTKLLKGSLGKTIGEDRISELPDEVLHHILSFLRIKSVVSTSVLSKRWRYLWISIPVLDFRQWRQSFYGYFDHKYSRSNELDAHRCINFVNRVLFLQERPNIQKFHLTFDKYLGEFRVNLWIITVIWRKVEELSLITYELVDSALLPHWLFTCGSLTRLELHMEIKLILPKSISFPRLKFLRLSGVKFVDESLTQQFFSNCPVLEELILSCCDWLDMKVVSISAPALKRLSIIGRSKGLNSCDINIYAPSLLSLKYENVVAKDYALCSVSSLVDAEIEFYHLVRSPQEKREEIGRSVTKFLGGLSNVKNLKMSNQAFEALSFAGDLITNLPAFQNLTHLEVSSIFCYPVDRTLFDFLQISPNLESIVFARGFHPFQSNDYDGSTLQFVPRCLLLCLKSVEFQCFEGKDPRELDVVKLFLKNAEVLQRLTISSSSLSATMKKTEIMEQLLRCPRGSKSCVIDFLSLWKW